MTSSIAIGIQKLSRSQTVVERLAKGEQAPIYAVRLADPKRTPAITVNRTFERDDEETGLTTAVLVFTCYAAIIQDLEALGSEVVAVLDGCDDFSALGETGISFARGGYDVTGYDERNNLLMRQIEFTVCW